MSGPDDTAAAVLGEYFRFADRDGGGWRALTELTGPVLRTQVAPTERAVGGGERVAASVWFLGFTARLVSPPFGTAALTGTLPVFTSDQVWSRGTGPLAAEPVDMRTGAAHSLGVTLHDELVVPLLTPLVESVAGEFALSRQVLWGNVASAVNGAWIVVNAVRPDLRDTADALRAGALDGQQFAGTYTMDAGFRRRSCCLLYRAPGGGLCADCVLRR